MISYIKWLCTCQYSSENIGLSAQQILLELFFMIKRNISCDYIKQENRNYNRILCKNLYIVSHIPKEIINFHCLKQLNVHCII